jgi:hypothetical protein
VLRLLRGGPRATACDGFHVLLGQLPTKEPFIASTPLSNEALST